MIDYVRILLYNEDVENMKGEIFMAKTATVNIRIDEHLKAEVENLLEGLGTDITNATRMFYSQLILHGGFPFEIRNQKTNVEKIRAMREGRIPVDTKIIDDVANKLCGIAKIPDDVSYDDLLAESREERFL